MYHFGARAGEAGPGGSAGFVDRYVAATLRHVGDIPGVIFQGKRRGEAGGKSFLAPMRPAWHSACSASESYVFDT